jgi:hypothetical protein
LRTEDLTYKADTSSDEITLHFAHLWFLHTVLGPEDPALDALAVNAAKALMGHILDHGFALCDAFGQPTTWAKWSPEYFCLGEFGWGDAPLNAAELLMYLRVTMAVTGETGRWHAAFEERMAAGYGTLTTRHAERLQMLLDAEKLDAPEELMFGDHMLATMAFWPLITLEPDEHRKALFRKGFAAWRGSIGREYNPGYDFPFHLACPEETPDWARLEQWFYRQPISRLAAPCNVTGRHDTPRRVLRGGGGETAWLLPDDERAVCKYDRNPWAFADERHTGGEKTVESCYVYTFAYWIGRWYGLIE